jgi:hypothetical protein
MSGAIGRTAQVLLSAGSMRSRAGKPIQATGFYLAGCVSLVLAVLKLTVIVDWSWWRVMLPLWVFSVHNAAYILVGFICLFFARYGEEGEDEEQPIDQTNLLVSYQFAALLFSLVFVDNVLRWLEGRGDSSWFWLCSGKSEMLVLFGVLGLVAHVFYWAGIVAVVNERRSGG